MLVLGLAVWLTPLTRASFSVSAGLVSSYAGLSFGQANDAQDQKMPEKPAPQPPTGQPGPSVAQCYYERICYRPVLKEREIQEVVYRMVPREEKYTCTVFVPVMRDVKRTQTYFVPVMKPVEYMTTIYVPVTVQEKRRITECNMVEEVIDVKYTQFVPKTVQQKRLVYYTEVERRLVEQMVPVCRQVMVPVTDQCGNCTYVCKPVFTNEKVTREICVPIVKSREVVCDVVVCEPVERLGKRTICKPVFTEKEVLVNVTRCEARQQKVSSTVCEMVPQTREVVCKVMDCEARQQTGVRTIMDCVPQTVTRKIQCVEMVPFTERIPYVVTSCCRPCW